MAKNPFIGQRDRMISLVEKQTTRSATGAETVIEVLVAEEWAHMEEISGSEETDGKIKHLVNRKYNIRYNEDVKAKSNNLILIDGNEKFGVIHVSEIGRKTALEIPVKAYE